MAGIESEIFDLIAQKANIDRATLTRATPLSDIKLESIDMLEIIFDVEEKFNVSVLYNANSAMAGGLTNAGDVVDYIENHMTPETRRPAV